MTNLDRNHYEQAGLWGAENVALPLDQIHRMDAIDRLLPDDVVTMIDVGAGDGQVLRHLLGTRRELRVVAAERSWTGLDRIAPCPRVQASIDAIPSRDRGFDAVVCCEVLEHLPAPIYEKAREELGRIADRHIVITVPNREVRRRADIVCSSCGCRYNRDRHLRSFDPRVLATLLPGFDLVTTVETGPRHPRYPRLLRTGMETMGLLPVFGAPSCPQCGVPYSPSRSSHQDRAALTDTPPSRGRYDRLRRMAPKHRHPYWLVALYTRGHVTRRRQGPRAPDR